MAANKKSQNVFAHSPSLQILWKCASQRRLVTKTLIHSITFKNIYNDVLQYINSKNRRRSPLSLILDSHLMLGLVYVYSKTVFLMHQDVEKLYKDAVVHRFFEFDAPVKSKLTRKKEAILTNTQWQIEIDENLLPDERILLERDFSIEIPRQPTPPVFVQSPDNLPPLPWEVAKPSHGKRITLLPDIEEPMPKFDLIDDRFGEPLPVPPITAMDVDQQEERTFFQPPSDDRSKELLRAPYVDRHSGVTDRYLHPSHDRTMDEHHPIRSVVSDLPPVSMAPMDTTSVMPVADQFTLDALAFFQNSLDTYPIYQSTSTRSILLSADCSSITDVPMIVIQEATVIGGDEPQIPMDTMPPLDQQIPSQETRPTAINAQVPEVNMTPGDEKEYFHLSKKKRNAPNALNRKRKYPTLYNNIVDFDYETLKTIEDEHNKELEELQREQKPWPTIVGRNGSRRMKTFIEKAKNHMTTIDLRDILNDITNIANMITNPDEPEGLAQARRTGQEIAIRRGQLSGLLPKAGTRSPSIVPVTEDRVSQLPISTLGGDILPTFPSGFDDIPLAPVQSEPLIDIRQTLSPLPGTGRDRTATALIQVEPSPTWLDKQKQKATNDILNLTESSDGASFNQFLKQSQSTRVQAARLFSILLVLCGEERINAHQKEPYDDIHLSSYQKDNRIQSVASDLQNFASVEPMDADDEDHF